MNLKFLTYTVKSKIFAGVRRIFLSITFLFTPIQLAQFLFWKFFKSKRRNTAEPLKSPATNLNIIIQNNSNPKVAIILHVFYPDIGIEILHQVLPKSNHFEKILITHNMTTAVLQEFQSGIPPELMSKCHFMIVENRFRDCGPFIQAAASPFLSDCSVYLKLHTKKSPHLPNDEGSLWRRDLINGLLNPKDIQNLIKHLATQSEPFWACPERWISSKSDWGFNSFQVWKLTRLLDIPFRGPQPFPVGNMYWLNRSLLDSFSPLGEQIVFDTRSPFISLQDGSEIHALERVVSSISLQLH